MRTGMLCTLPTSASKAPALPARAVESFPRYQMKEGQSGFSDCPSFIWFRERSQDLGGASPGAARRFLPPLPNETPVRIWEERCGWRRDGSCPRYSNVKSRDIVNGCPGTSHLSIRSF